MLVSLFLMFYEQLFVYKSIFEAFLQSQFGFVIFWWKYVGAKAAPRMLVKFHT